MGERRGTKALEVWCRRLTEGYSGVKIDNMTTSWRDGLAFCAIIHHFRPDLIDFTKLNKDDVYYNNSLAFRIAERHLGIPALLDAEDMVEYLVPDRLSILTYLSQFYQVFVGTSGSPTRIVAKRPAVSPDSCLSPPSTSPPTKMAARSHGASGALGRREPCAKCSMPVFLAERLHVGSKLYHRTCFRCARCNNQLSLANCYETEEDGVYCCETCPDEEGKVSDEKLEPILSESLSDEQKSKSLKKSEFVDEYSAFFETALEEEETAMSKARKAFVSSQMLNESSDDDDLVTRETSFIPETTDTSTSTPIKSLLGDKHIPMLKDSKRKSIESDYASKKDYTRIDDNKRSSTSPVDTEKSSKNPKIENSFIVANANVPLKTLQDALESNKKFATMISSAESSKSGKKLDTNDDVSKIETDAKENNIRERISRSRSNSPSRSGKRISINDVINIIGTVEKKNNLEKETVMRSKSNSPTKSIKKGDTNEDTYKIGTDAKNNVDKETVLHPKPNSPIFVRSKSNSPTKSIKKEDTNEDTSKIGTDAKNNLDKKIVLRPKSNSPIRLERKVNNEDISKIGTGAKDNNLEKEVVLRSRSNSPNKFGRVNEHISKFESGAKEKHLEREIISRPKSSSPSKSERKENTKKDTCKIGTIAKDNMEFAALRSNSISPSKLSPDSSKIESPKDEVSNLEVVMLRCKFNSPVKDLRRSPDTNEKISSFEEASLRSNLPPKQYKDVPPLPKSKPPDIDPASLTTNRFGANDSVNNVSKFDSVNSGKIDQQNTAYVLVDNNVTKERKSLVKTRMLLFENQVPSKQENEASEDDSVDSSILNKENPSNVERVSKYFGSNIISSSAPDKNNSDKVPLKMQKDIERVSKYFGNNKSIDKTTSSKETFKKVPTISPERLSKYFGITPREENKSKTITNIIRLEKSTSVADFRKNNNPKEIKESLEVNSRSRSVINLKIDEASQVPSSKFQIDKEITKNGSKISDESEYFPALTSIPVISKNLTENKTPDATTNLPDTTTTSLELQSKTTIPTNISDANATKSKNVDELEITTPKMPSMIDSTSANCTDSEMKIVEEFNKLVNEETDFKLQDMVLEDTIEDNTVSIEDITDTPNEAVDESIKDIPNETDESINVIRPSKSMMDLQKELPPNDLKEDPTSSKSMTAIRTTKPKPEIRTQYPSKSSTLPVRPKKRFGGKREYPQELNPFDDEEVDDPNKGYSLRVIKPSTEDLTMVSPISEVRKTGKEEFDDDSSGSKPPTPASRSDGGKKVLEAPRINLNPFWSDGEEPSDEEGSTGKPVPLPRSSRHNLDTPEPKPRKMGRNSDKYDSNSSLSSMGSSINSTRPFTPGSTAHSLTPSRKKKPAPLPPQNTSPACVALDITNSPTPSSQVSPKVTPHVRRKHRKAPLPPTSTPFVASRGPDQAPSPSPIRDEDESPKPVLDSDISTGDTQFISCELNSTTLSNDVEREKTDKDEQNRNRQSQSISSPVSESESISASTTPDKSTFGKWKRRKGPAPSRPVPQRRQIKPLPLQQLRQELDVIEMQQQGLEKQGVKLEQLIREKCEAPGVTDEAALSPEVEELVIELFELVNEKNELFRKQAELMYLRRQQRLEEEYADLEYQIRCLMDQPERNKTDSDKAREEELINRLVEVVERRNEIVECLEMDRVREAEEDHSISTRLNLIASKREEEFLNAALESPIKLSKKEKKKIKKEKKMKDKGKNVDIDKDIDESETVSNTSKEKKKRKWF